MRPCASHWAPAPPSRPGGARPWYPWLGDGWACYGLHSGSARGRQQRSSSGQEHQRGWPGVSQVLPPPGTLELGSAPALVARQGQAPGDERLTEPGITVVCFSPLPPQHTMSHGTQPQLQYPTGVPAWDCPLAQPDIPHPVPLLTAQQCPAPESPSTSPAHLHSPARSSGLHDSVSLPGDGCQQASGDVREGG